MTATDPVAEHLGTDSPLVIGVRLLVTGVVQGVGFRPFVFRLANALGLTGEVSNDSTGVTIFVEGLPEVVEDFVQRLHTEAPPLARVDSIERVTVDDDGPVSADFRIVESTVRSGDRTLVSPDSAPCADCVGEMNDPADRRYRHPFISCTNCGPRFSIVEAVPYDREHTTMAGFEMCPKCAEEYLDPFDRRYHAQPIACHRCGPTVAFGRGVDELDDSDALAHAIAALKSGSIVAVKGVGGYQLLCDASNAHSVGDLRRRKRRPDKPFAVMVANTTQAEQLAELSVAERSELASIVAPIVLVRATEEDTALDELVAPGSPLVGLMLPSSPLHHLIAEGCATPLVITSANRPGEPLAISHDTIADVRDLYDFVLDHDRPIHTPVDDSVVRLVDDEIVPLRRARGYAPIPVYFAAGNRAVVAAGGEMKNTCCVTDGGRAWVSQHIGDMENLATLDRFEAVLSQFQEMYGVSPKAIAVDAHPGYMSSNWARRAGDVPVVEIQHHHAHIAAVMAEHDLDPHKPVLGYAFDGTGYGTDGTIWGGEALLATATSFDRVGHLNPILLPGGDAAVQRPSHVALAHLHAAGIPWDQRLSAVGNFTDGELALLRQQLDRSIACVPTTSMGRLFDAVSSLIGVRHRISYEAQAAIELETLATFAPEGLDAYRFDLEGTTIDQTPVIREVVADVLDGRASAEIAWCFHAAVADVVQRVAEGHPSDSFDTVVLSGGVFQNGLLHRLCVERLGRRFDVRSHQLVPPNDGGLALGQAFIAAHLPNDHLPATT